MRRQGRGCGKEEGLTGGPQSGSYFEKLSPTCPPDRGRGALGAGLREKVDSGPVQGGRGGCVGELPAPEWPGMAGGGGLWLYLQRALHPPGLSGPPHPGVDQASPGVAGGQVVPPSVFMSCPLRGWRRAWSRVGSGDEPVGRAGRRRGVGRETGLRVRVAPCGPGHLHGCQQWVPFIWLRDEGFRAAEPPFSRLRTEPMVAAA